MKCSNFLLKTKFSISSNQSGFKPADSSVNQLVFIRHEIYKSFDVGHEVRGIFLDISKTFDKVFHNGIIFKLTQNGISGNLLKLLGDFSSERRQREVLNGQASTWTNVTAGVPQGFFLGPLLFLIYINDFSEGLSTNAKLFADNASLFSVIHDSQTSANAFNKDLEIIHNWDFQWRINFNPDSNKQVQEFFFSRKTKKLLHPSLVFDNANVTQSIYQKHLDMILDSKLTFENHINVVTIGLLHKLQNLLPRTVLITIYKAFVRPHLVHSDMLYDQAFNLSFQQKLESIQYRSCLAITGTMRGTSREKTYQELGLESPRWYRKLAMFYKIYKNKNPFYLFNLMPKKTSCYATRNVDYIPLIKIKHNVFKNTFFPFAIIEWNKLDPTIRNAESFGIFKSNILKFIKPTPRSFFNCYNHKEIRIMTRLRLGLSHLREHKFNHNFQNCINPLCSCGMDIESTSHFFRHCPLFDDERITLPSTLSKIDCKLIETNKSSLIETLLLGNSSFDSKKTSLFLMHPLITFYLLKKPSKKPYFNKF